MPSEFETRVISQVKDWLVESQTANVSPLPSEKRLADLVRDESGVRFAIAFIDRVIRPESSKIAAENLRALARDVPSFLPAYQRFALKLGAFVSVFLPGLVVTITRRVLRSLVGHLVVDARRRKFARAMKRMREAGTSVNINLLGEAVLGDSEALKRRDGVLKLLSRPDVDYVSVKVSAIAAQLSMWSYQQTVERVIDRLLPLYELAHTENTFINLDMEEYRDLDLTLDVFMTILDKFPNLRAGIVLQTYLPDALRSMQRLQQWAAQRVEHGGSDIKVRIVKGANLQMEIVDAQLHGWPLATFGSKAESDANYKRVIEWAMTPERARNISLGVAGHNLFDIAHAWLLAQDRGITDRVQFEMLLGMASGQTQTIARHVGGLLMYVPVVHPADFDSAIAYLIRRLEENASQENFMSAIFDIDNNPELFERECTRYLTSVELQKRDIPPTHRNQDRRTPPSEPEPRFANTPDTDPALAANRSWITNIAERIPHSTIGRTDYSVTRIDQIESAITRALTASGDWGSSPASTRAALLRKGGHSFNLRRHELIEVMASECGKVISEADVEVSEAVDFALYYADSAEELDRISGATFVPARLCVVAPPWNFPVAIVAGSTLAALAAGSSVIVKPAPQARRSAAAMVEALWDAGISRDVLQIIDAPEGDLGKHLISHPAVDHVILTGSIDTATLFKSWRPDMVLSAETSGKNAIIVTEHADLDLAAGDIARSAFGHAGQKCSAASMAILVGSVGTSQRFKRQLIDAVTTMKVGYPSDLESVIGPVIEPPQGKLQWALTTLEPGEEWWLEPTAQDDRLFTPGIRGSVREGSRSHLEEFFGPMLAVIAVDTLEDAIRIQNGTDYGLTAGLHSLDQAEIELWLKDVEAGNLYVNRGITGAIVRRQPFGGWKRSSVGSGIKAGGPHYVQQFGTWKASEISPLGLDLSAPVESLLAAARHRLSESEIQRLLAALEHDELVWRKQFGVSTDVSQLGIEINALRYRPRHDVLIRASADSTMYRIARVLGAALRSGATVQFSGAHEDHRVFEPFVSKMEVESSQVFLHRMGSVDGGRIRVIGTSERTALVDALGPSPDWYLDFHEVTSAPQVEVLFFLKEQSVTVTNHRFGNHPGYDIALT